MTFDLRQFAATVRVTDGVYGTELQRQRLLAGGCPELLNDTDPEIVEAIARSYVEAGSDVILTNSLSAHRFGLAPHGAERRAAELAEAAAAISRRAARGTDVKVFGSFGPTGKVVMLEEVSRDALASAFAETAEALAWGGAEAIVLETFNELAEVRIALEAVQAACDLPVVVSMTFSSGPDQTMTMMGETPAKLAAMAGACGADAVGANCGIGPEAALRVVRLLAEATDLPVWVKPNAGLPVVADGRTTFDMPPEKFAAFVPDFIGAGASFVGGGCGTTPDHVRAIRRQVDRLPAGAKERQP